MELTEEQKRVCVQAVTTFGKRCQVLHVVEELRELADALEKAAKGEGNLDEIIDERADVAIMLYQLDELLLPSMATSAAKHIQNKIDKLRGYL